MSLFHAGLQQALDSNGEPISGATWSFYLSGTLTPTAVYADAALNTSLGSSETADAAGRFAVMFLDDNVATRAILRDAGGTTINDIDPVDGAADSNGITLLRDAVGAVARSLADWFDDDPSVMDFIPLVERIKIRLFTSSAANPHTPYLQAAYDHYGDLGGGRLKVPRGKYIVGDLIRRQSVSLVGAGAEAHGYIAGGTPTQKTVFEQEPGSTWILNDPVGGASFGGIVGIDFQGSGLGGNGAGVRLGSGTRDVNIMFCSFNGFDHQGVLLDTGSVGNRVERCLGLNLVLERVRTQLTGCVEDRGTDNYIVMGEWTPSINSGAEGENGITNITNLTTITGDTTNGSATVTSVSSIVGLAQGMILAGVGIPVGARILSFTAGIINLDIAATATAAGVTLTPRRPDLYICGVLMAGVNSWAIAPVGEFAERGIHSTSQLNKLIGVRGDRNAGHGVTGAATITGGGANDNSRYINGLWDNANFNGTQGGNTSGFKTVTLGAMAPRYGLQCLGGFGALASRHTVRGFTSQGHLIAPISNDPTLPHDISSGRHYVLGTGATPDVTDCAVYIPGDAGAVTITNFVGGVFGQDLYVRGNVNVTIQHSTSITLPDSINMGPLIANQLYHFKRDAAAWRFVGARPFARGATVAAPAGGATIDAEARTAIGSLITRLQAANIIA